ncbi:MAG: DNA primase, partial [Gammaproteobacteria bacterium]|nr:DNA primase [Gammaproteobacteria bacterium]
MNSDQILSLLDGVRDNRGGNYMARCPAHDDRSPSLSVKFCADGRVLLHCFAGCAIEAVCDSIGVTLADLMPPAPLSHRKRQVRSKMPAGEALKSLDYESLVVAVIAS